jgi:hypothetical protein
MALVLDAGALIAVDRLDRKVGAILRVAQQGNMPVRTSAAVVAQVWRSGSHQANVARVLTGIDVAALAAQTGRSVGEILALSRTADAVDGHLAFIVRSGDTVLTSDTNDIKKILNARDVSATLRRV